MAMGTSSAILISQQRIATVDEEAHSGDFVPP